MANDGMGQDTPFGDDAWREDDARLLALIRRGDPEGGRRLVQQYYAGVYRYLRYLTGAAELAEDLTQQTFLQAWQHLDQFQGRAPLRVWLHEIARREFLQARRRQKPVASLEEAPERPASAGDTGIEAAEIRLILEQLPAEESELLLLHYLDGYSSNEIARIVHSPASTVRHRLGVARARLQRALGEGARELWGLAEWDLACNRELRPHLRWLSTLTPAEREQAQRAPGLRFTALSLPHQQQFMALATGSAPDAISSLEELATATLQLDYSRPGEYEWRPPHPDGAPEPPEVLAPARGRTPAAALAAARRIDPQADPAQIQLTQLALALLYRWGTTEASGTLWITAHGRSQTGVGRTRERTRSS